MALISNDDVKKYENKMSHGWTGLNTSCAMAAFKNSSFRLWVYILCYKWILNHVSRMKKKIFDVCNGHLLNDIIFAQPMRSTIHRVV